MSTLNLTFYSEKEFNLIIKNESLVELMDKLEKTDLKGIDVLILWSNAIDKQWWSGAKIIEQFENNFAEKIKTWKNKQGNSVWHSVAKASGEWEACHFIDAHGLSFEKNNKGQTPLWEIKNDVWLILWSRKINKKAFIKELNKKDNEGASLLEHWIREKRWSLACWAVANGAVVNDEIRAIITPLVKVAPLKWQQMWNLWVPHSTNE